MPLEGYVVHILSPLVHILLSPPPLTIHPSGISHFPCPSSISSGGLTTHSPCLSSFSTRDPAYHLPTLQVKLHVGAARLPDSPPPDPRFTKANSSSPYANFLPSSYASFFVDFDSIAHHHGSVVKSSSTKELFHQTDIRSHLIPSVYPS